MAALRLAGIRQLGGAWRLMVRARQRLGQGTRRTVRGERRAGAQMLCALQEVGSRQGRRRRGARVTETAVGWVRPHSGRNPPAAAIRRSSWWFTRLRRQPTLGRYGAIL